MECNTEKWPEPNRPPDNIKLEYDHDSRAPKPVYVNGAKSPEIPKPAPEAPKIKPEASEHEPVNEKSGFLKKLWEGGADDV